MSERVRGEPDRLEAYTTETTRTLPPLRLAIDDYAEAVRILNNSSADLPVSIEDDSGHLHAIVGRMQRLDAAPGAFAWALRRLDRQDPDPGRVNGGAGVVEIDDVELFHRLVDLRTADPLADDDVIWAEAQADTQLSAEDLAVSLGRVVDAAAGPVARRSPSDIDVPADFGDLESLDSWTASTIHDVVATLRGQSNDADFLVRFYRTLGPQRTASLPTVVAGLLSGGAHPTGTQADVDLRELLAAAGGTLAVASPGLDEQWRRGLFAAGAPDGTLDHGFPLLFSTAEFAAPFAVDAGNLGIDAIDGTVWAESGEAGPAYEAMGRAGDHWAGGGALLMAAAARTPKAANVLVRDEDNVRRLTDDGFGRRQRPDLPVMEAAPWGLIVGPVGALLAAGTVAYATTEPQLARAAAVGIVEAAAPGWDPAADSGDWHLSAGRRVREWIEGAGSAVGDFFAAAAGSAGAVVKGVSEQLRQVDTAAAAQIAASTSILAGVPALVAGLTERVADTVDGVSRAWAGLVEDRGDVVTEALDFVSRSVAAPARAAFGLAVPIPDRDDIERIVDGGKRVIGRVVEAGRDTVGRVVEAGKGLLGGLLDRGRRLVGGAIDAGKSLVGGVVDAGKDALGKAVDAGRNLAGKALSGLKSLFGGAVDWVVEKFNAVMDAALGWLHDQVQAFVAALGPFLESLEKWWKEVAWPAIDKWVDENAGVVKVVSAVLQGLAFVADLVGLVLLFTPFAPFAPLAFGVGRVFAAGALGVDALLAATGNGDWGDVATDAALLLIPFGRLGKPIARFLKPLLGPAFRALGPVFRWVKDAIGPVVRRLVDVLGSARKWIDDTVAPVLRRIRDGIGRTWDRLRRFWDEIPVRRRATRELGDDLGPKFVDELGAEATERLIKGLGPEAITKLSRTLSPSDIARLNDELGPDVLRKLSSDIDGSVIRKLVDDLDAPTVKKLSEDLTGAEILRLTQRLDPEFLIEVAKVRSGRQIDDLVIDPGYPTDPLHLKPPRRPDGTIDYEALRAQLLAGKVPENLRKAIEAEAAMMEHIRSLGHAPMSAPKNVSDRGPDSVTFDPRTGTIVIWDAKYRSTGPFPKTIPPDQLKAWQSYIDDAIRNYNGIYNDLIADAAAKGKIEGIVFPWPPR